MSESRNSRLLFSRHNTYPSGLSAARNNSSELFESLDDLFKISKPLIRSRQPQDYNFRSTASIRLPLWGTSQEMSSLRGGSMNYWKIQTGIYLMYGGTSCTEAHTSLEAVVTETQRTEVCIWMSHSRCSPRKIILWLSRHHSKLCLTKSRTGDLGYSEASSSRERTSLRTPQGKH